MWEQKNRLSDPRLPKLEKKKKIKRLSKHPIDNAITEMDLPLSDQEFGPFKMTPPELLHVSGSGLISYMFSTLKDAMTDKDRSVIDDLHQEMHRDSQWQSKKDFPVGSTRNGIVDGTKCMSTERRGNLFRLACIAMTTAGAAALQSV